MEKVYINIEQGILKGKTGTDYNGRKYNAFLGIPYAKPPLGELRFKAPQPLESWSGIKNAAKDGNECFSRDNVRGIVGSEDCLFLNVFMSELLEKYNTLKPVMVWIHGGGFVSGSNKSDMYGPNYLLTEDVIVVTVNYRTGSLGFLSMDDPAVDVPGNAGFKDIILALKWVQKYIKSFGGDPNNVTIFGENAGGVAVHLLVLSPIAKGLFQRAIIQNGSALNPWLICKSSYKKLAQVLECPHTSEEKILAFLQKLPIEKLYEGQEKLNSSFSSNFDQLIGPVVEKGSPHEPAFLREHPLKIISKGDYNKVPLIMGYAYNKNSLIEVELNEGKEMENENFDKYIAIIFNVEYESDLCKSIVTKLVRLYMGNEASSLSKNEKLHELLADISLFYGIYSSLKYHAVSSSELSFFYKFIVDANLNMSKIPTNSTPTGDELGYVFKSIHHPDVQPDSIEDITIRRMIKLWTNFAKTGDPNPIKGTTWRPVFEGEVNRLDIGEKLINRENPEEEKMKLWDEIFDLISENIKQ